ncbi:MAG: hypothetical protein JXR03_02780 [Cyclobacteriaceae bacterium]
MNNSLIRLTYLFSSILFLIACTDDETSPVPIAGESPFENIRASDIENRGDATDISFSFTIKTASSKPNEIRVLIAIDSLTEESALESINFKTVTETSSESIVFESNQQDVEGGLVIEDQPYLLYLLGLYDDGVSTLSDPVKLTLLNEIVVTTPHLSSEFKASEDIAIAPDGTLYINGGRLSEEIIYKVTPLGESSIFAEGMNRAIGIAMDDEGNIYASNINSTIINKVTPSGEVSVFMNDDRLQGGGGLAFDNSGNLYNTFYSTTKLFKMSDGSIEEFLTHNAFDGPVGVTYDKARGNLYVSSFNSGKIFHVVSSEEVVEVADTPAQIGHLSYANDHFYITGWSNNKVYKVNLEGEVVSDIGTGGASSKDGSFSEASFNKPNGIEATPDGKYVYVSEGGNGALRKIIMERE